MDPFTIKILTPENERDAIVFNKLCFPVDYWKEEDWHSLLVDPRAVYYALFDGEQLIGNVFVYNWQGEKDYVKIMNISVHPDYRNRSLAHLLLRHVTEEMSKLGMKRFCGETRASNVSMQRVFDGCGYRLAKIEENYFENPNESAYKYVLDL